MSSFPRLVPWMLEIQLGSATDLAPLPGVNIPTQSLATHEGRDSDLISCLPDGGSKNPWLP